MARVSKLHNDPTIKVTELTLGGHIYSLVFTFGALAHAQTQLRKLGVEANLLHALDLSNLTPDQIAPLLYAAIVTHQPDVPYAAIESLVSFRTLPAIMTALAEAYVASLAEPTPAEEAPIPLVEAAQS